MKKKGNGRGLTVLIVVVFFAGLSFLLYPTISNYWNSLHQAQVIVDYDRELDQLTKETYERLWAEAEEWNRTTAHKITTVEGELAETYYDLLDFSGRDVMGYLEIPSIGVNLPVGHGTGDAVLQNSVGHLEWSSLPVGGEGTHCVLSGHRGLPSSELLTNIDRMEVGDRFSLHVLGEELVYQVDRISVVEPHDTSLLGIEAGKEYVTLLTCTPYGINSHRLLVRGVRLEQLGEEVSAGLNVTADVEQLGLGVLVPVTLLGLAAVVFLALVFSERKRKNRGGKYIQKTTDLYRKGEDGDET